jgi:hypothetical protein
MHKLVPAFLLAILLPLASFAQHDQCGSSHFKDRNWSPIIPTAKSGNMTVLSNKCLNKKLYITAYVVKDSLGQTNIADSTILNNIADLNRDFAPICVTFEICTWEYIDNYQFNDWVDTLDDPQAAVLYYQPDQINMYFVRSVVVAGNQVPGYAWMPGGADRVVIAKNTVGSKNIAHQLGHFFGLLDTSDDAVPELVDHSNCSSGGDYICDTQADPMPNGSYSGAACEFFEYTQDANGDYYLPPVDNIMSLYGLCRCVFTNEQYARMVYQYLTFRSYLW